MRKFQLSPSLAGHVCQTSSVGDQIPRPGQIVVFALFRIDRRIRSLLRYFDFVTRRPGGKRFDRANIVRVSVYKPEKQGYRDGDEQEEWAVWEGFWDVT
jgi:hypothetical protein